MFIFGFVFFYFLAVDSVRLIKLTYVSFQAHVKLVYRIESRRIYEIIAVIDSYASSHPFWGSPLLLLALPHNMSGMSLNIRRTESWFKF